jgi:hypothetical protein
VKTEPARMEPDEIKRVARGLVEGKVFCAEMCEPDMISMVFMPVGMGGLENHDIDKIGTVYEWLSKAGERGINGYPMFMSCQVVHVEDWTQITTKAGQIAEAIEKVLE